MLTSRHPSRARFADRPEDFAKLGVQPGHIAAFEDGMRTDGGPGSYEWWYFDCHLSDGSSLVIIFFTKPMMKPDERLAPFASFELNRPGQPQLRLQAHASPDAFSASRDRCDVRIAENTFRGNLHEYDIHFAHGEVTADIKLRGGVPAWRPTSGHLYFGEQDEHSFGWFPSVPQGKVFLDLNIGETKQHLEGVGYHDHNWGNVAMAKIINHWHWGRAKVGAYSIVASYIVSEKAYGNAELPLFMLAKDGKIVADDSRKVTFHIEDEHIDQKSRKPVANVTVYEYQDGPERYRVSYLRTETIANTHLIGPRGLKRLLAKLLHFRGAYLRFTGKVRLERFTNGRLVEDLSGPGIWELMYFGRVYRRSSL